MLTVRHSPELKRDEAINGVRIVRLHPIARFSRGMITPAVLWAAAKLIHTHDVVQIHTPLPEGPLIGAWCRALRKPMLMTHHGDLVMPSGLYNRTLEWIGYYNLLATGKLAHAVTSYSRDYAEHSRLLRHFENKLTCVFPPVSIPVPEAQATQAWRRELGLADKLLIGFAGRWVEEKGFDYLLQALPLIRAAYPKAHLIYAGEPHVVYDHFYERCLSYIAPIKEHLTILGLIRDQQKMANFYALCDVFVQPSRTDMMGLTQIEAMLCGTPVVVSDIPGARVVVNETGFGRLAPPHNPRALAETICDILQHRYWYNPTRQAVCQIFSIEKSLAQYQALLESLVVARQCEPATPSLAPTMINGIRK